MRVWGGRRSNKSQAAELIKKREEERMQLKEAKKELTNLAKDKRITKPERMEE